MNPLRLLVLPLLLSSAQPQLEDLLTRAERLGSNQVRKADQAEPLFREAIGLAHKQGLAKQEARAWMGLGLALLRLHRQPEAKQALETGLALARQGAFIEEETGCLLILALLEHERGDFDRQAVLIQRALEAGKRSGYVTGRLRALNTYIAMLRRLGRTSEATRNGRIALMELDHATASGQKIPVVLQFQIPYNLGKALVDTGDHAAGIQLLERARIAAENQGNLAGIWHVLHDLGEISAATGDIEAAARYYTRALEIARRIESRDPEGVTLRGLGEVAEAHGEIESALRHYTESIAVLDRAGIDSEKPYGLVALSRIQWRAGHRSLASQTMARAMESAEGMNHVLGLTHAYLERGAQNEEAGRFAQADADYRQALELARTNAIQTLLPAAWQGIATTARSRGDFPRALQAFAAAAQAVDSIRARLPSEQQRISFVATTHAIYRAWIETLLDSGGSEREAFLILERERSRNLLDALRDTDAPAPGRRNPTLEARVAQLQLLLGSPELPPDRRKELMRQLEDLERQLDLIVPPASTGQPAQTLETLQRALADDELFVAYSPRPDGILIFGVWHDGVSVFRRPAQDLDARVSIFNRALAESDEQEAMRTGLELARLLLEPLALEGSRRRLIISASGELAALPFAALPMPARGRPLMESFEVVYSPSLSALAVERSSQPSRPRNAMLAVAPLGALPATLREIQRASTSIRGRVDTLIDTTATETSLKAQPLSDYRVLHFATHAVLDSRFPARSAIELAATDGEDDGRLQIREIYRLQLADPLVVLSACATAFGRASAAEGMQSLAQAFLYAGARTVVGTLWKVEDRAAERFIDEFYQRLGSGAHVSAALRGAQMTIAGERPYARAASWAPWIVTGDAARHDVRPDGTRTAQVTISLVALVSLLGITTYLLAHR